MPVLYRNVEYHPSGYYYYYYCCSAVAEYISLLCDSLLHTERERLIFLLTLVVLTVPGIDIVQWQNKQSVTNPDDCLWVR